MPVTARTCIRCGTRHWSTQPCLAQEKTKPERAKKAVEAVTIKAPVAESEMPVAKSIKGGRRQGAGRKPIGVKAMTPAERMRKTRANRSANKSV
jgi:hypothetical protein